MSCEPLIEPLRIYMRIGDYDFYLWKSNGYRYLEIDTRYKVYTEGGDYQERVHKLVMEDICLNRLSTMLTDLMHMLCYNRNMTELVGYLGDRTFNHAYRLYCAYGRIEKVNLQIEDREYQFIFRQIDVIDTIRSFIAVIKDQQSISG